MHGLRCLVPLSLRTTYGSLLPPTMLKSLDGRSAALRSVT